MTDLITEARELCERAEILVNELHTERIDYNTEYLPLIDAIQTIPELCDALEKAEEQSKQLLHEVCKLACESVEREKTLARLEAEVEQAIAATRWIPVSERLPEKYQSVLAARQAYAPNKQHYVCEAWLNDFNWQNSCGTMENVTNWMPLPAPPEEGAERERD